MLVTQIVLDVPGCGWRRGAFWHGVSGFEALLLIEGTCQAREAVQHGIVESSSVGEVSPCVKAAHRSEC